jgi:hypothetical protein
MSYKIKSVLYFASLVLALITYYHIDNVDSFQNKELANNFENVSSVEAFK